MAVLGGVRAARSGSRTGRGGQGQWRPAVVSVRVAVGAALRTDEDYAAAVRMLSGGSASRRSAHVEERDLAGGIPAADCGARRDDRAGSGDGAVSGDDGR